MNWLALGATIGIVGLVAGWFAIWIYLDQTNVWFGLAWPFGSFIVLLVFALYSSLKKQFESDSEDSIILQGLFDENIASYH